MTLAGETRTIQVDYLARVEGEGSLFIRLEGGRTTEVRLGIFEPPGVVFDGFKVIAQFVGNIRLGSLTPIYGNNFADHGTCQSLVSEALGLGTGDGRCQPRQRRVELRLGDCRGGGAGGVRARH